jgi:flagellar biosynthesis/type III secretory pathway M-ring protein FliF/YscJ
MWRHLAEERQICHWWHDFIYRKVEAMVAWLLVVIVLGLLVYGLERNHRRQARNRPRGALEILGSTDVEDRDAQRVAADLRAIAASAPLGRTPASASTHPLQRVCGADSGCAAG